MVARTAPPAPDGAAVRLALVESAARLIATEGPAALTLRRVADEVGTSTMAVYTHFGGMPELRRAVRREGFARLAARLAVLTPGKDPVADLALLGLAYYDNALANPDLYRVMFMEQPLDAADAAVGWDTFDALVSASQRCLGAGRLEARDARAVATQLWALAHGIVTLELAGLLGRAEALATLADVALRLFVGYGDDPTAARRSLALAGRRHRSAAS